MPPGGVRFGWVARLVGAGMALYLRLVARTARISGDVTRAPVVLTFWHEYNLAVLTVCLRRRADLRHASFSTRGLRGIVISSLLESSGIPLQVLALPPESDRAAARSFARRLGELGEAGWSPVVTPDGPWGPPRIAKPGAMLVARASGLPIQPWAVVVRPEWRLSRRWDRQLVPLPFCRLRIIAGEVMTIDARERISPRLAQLQAELDRITSLAGPAR